MTAPIIGLCDAVQAAASAASGKTFVRRYAPYYESAAVADGVWYAVPVTEEVQKKRLVDIANGEIVLVYQRALPDSTMENPNPLENNAFLDACMDEVESVKTLFREGGALADVAIVGWVFLRMTNTPAYQPFMLEDYQIFTSAIRLEFLAEEQ